MSENKAKYTIEQETEDLFEDESVDLDNYQDTADLEILIDVFGEKILDGIDDIAETIGKIHGLGIVGVDPKDALEYLLQLQGLEHERLILEENNKLQLEITKIEGIKNAKNEI